MARELMVEEYKSLRQEMLQLLASISRWQLTGFISAGAAVALAIIFKQPLVIIASLFVLFASNFAIIRDTTTYLRIAAYIQVFHEGRDTGAMWGIRDVSVESVPGMNLTRSFTSPIFILWWLGLASIPFVFILDIPDIELYNYFALDYVIPIAWLAYGLYLLQYSGIFGSWGRKAVREAYYESLKRPSGEDSQPSL